MLLEISNARMTHEIESSSQTRCTNSIDPLHVHKHNALNKLKKLIDENPCAAKTRKENGDLLLNLACKRWFPDETCVLTMDANLEVIEKKDSNGVCPLINFALNHSPCAEMF